MPQPDTPLASVSVDRICQVFNYEWAETNPDTYWWWVRDIRLDPDEVIADDGEGGTYRVPFTTDGDYQVTFGEPVQVRETFVDLSTAPAAAASAAAARVKQRVIARALPKPNKPDKGTTAASAATTQEDDRVPIDIPALRSRLELSTEQLPDDATEEQINAALSAEQTETTETVETGGTTAETETVTETTAETGGETTQTGTTKTAETGGTEPTQAPDLIAAAQTQALAETSARVAQLEAQATAREHAETRQRRDSLATQWVTEGRIAPAERDHYRGLLDIDETRTTTLAASLAAGRIPVRERGHDLDAAAAASGAPTTTGWLPQLKEA